MGQPRNFWEFVEKFKITNTFSGADFVVKPILIEKLTVFGSKGCYVSSVMYEKNVCVCMCV